MNRDNEVDETKGFEIRAISFANIREDSWENKILGNVFLNENIPRGYIGRCSIESDIL